MSSLSDDHVAVAISGFDNSDVLREMTKSVFIALPKKPGATKCELFRTISLMSQLTKLILRVLLNRIRGRTAGEAVSYTHLTLPTIYSV